MTTIPQHSRRSVLRAAGVVATGAAALAVTGRAGAATGRPQRVVIFSRTNGYRHASIPNAIAALKDLGVANGVDVVATEDPGVFTREGLRDVTAIAFASTQGNVLTNPARAAIEDFVRSGGGWMGIHAAADTEYDWPFYTELLSGGRFLCHPLMNQSGRVVREVAGHLSTAALPAVWTIPSEEFYSFKKDVRGTAQVLLRLDESSYCSFPNTALLPPPPPTDVSLTTLVPTLLTELTAPRVISGKMGDHPLCWQAPVGRGLSWYTALGHEPALYADPLFRSHLLGGLLTVSRHGAANLVG